MPQIKISKLGEIGISSDLPPSAIPVNAFSFGKNLRAFHGRARNFGGHDVVTTAPIEPYSLFTIQTPGRETYWIEAGLTAVYVYDGTNHTDISRLAVPYTTNEYVDRWTGGIQGTLAALNNTADGPQQWTTINVGTRLIDMMYDPQAAPGSQTWQELGYRAYAMRPYQSFLIGLGITRGATQLPALVQWSESISPGATQVDWVQRATNSAGERYLGATTGNIVDGAALRDDFIIYKEDSAHRMSFTGDANNPFIFERLPDYVRLINRGCIGQAEEFHVLASRDDVHIYDGNNFRSLLNHSLREFYINTMFPERLLTTFVSVLPKEHEVWICFPSVGGSATKSPDRAIVWNYEDNTLSLTELPEVRDLDQGVVVPQIDDSFDSEVPVDLIFDEDLLRFDQTPFTSALDFLIGAHGTNISIFGEVPTEEGKPRECIAERTGIVLPDPDGGMNSVGRQYQLTEARPYMEATGQVYFQLGVQDAHNGPIAWTPEQTFDPRTQSHLRFRTDVGAYAAYRIRSDSAIDWNLTELEIGYEPIRRR